MKRERKYLKTLGAAVLLLLALVFVQYRYANFEQPSDVIGLVEDRILEVERSFHRLVNGRDTSIARLLTNEQTLQDLQRFQDLPYTLLVYSREKLVFWSSNKESLLPYSLNSIPPKRSFRKLRDGYYMIMVQPLYRKNIAYEKVSFVALYMMQKEYGISENQYLSNECNPEFGISRNFQFGTSPTANSVPFYSSNGEPELHLDRPEYAHTSGFTHLQKLLQALTTFLMALFFLALAVYIAEKRTPLWGLIFLVSALLLLYASIHGLHFPLDTTGFIIFQKYSEFNSIFGSIGDLVLNLIGIFIVLFYFKNYLPLRFREDELKGGNATAYFSVLLIIVLGLVYLSVTIISQILMRTEVNFRLTDYLNFNPGTFAVTFSVILIFASLYLMMSKLIPIVGELALNFRQRMQVAVIVLLIFLFLHVFLWIDASILLICLVVLGFAAILPWLEEAMQDTWSFKAAIFWIFFFASFTTFLVNTLGFEKERIQRRAFAKELASVENKKLEEEFDEIAILDDPLIKMIFKDPLLPMNSSIKRLKTKYFRNYFSQFTIDIKFYFTDDRPLLTSDRQTLADVREKIDRQGVNTQNSYLWKIANPAGRYGYLAKLPIFAKNEEGESRTLGYIVMEFEESDPNKSNVYPELVVQDKYRKKVASDAYNFAVYNASDELESHDGIYSYPKRLSQEFRIADQQRFISTNGLSHYLEKAENGRTVIVTSKKKTILELFSLFSYIFFFLGMLVFLAILIQSVFSKQGRNSLMYELFYSSLKRRINSTILGIIFASFLAIGIITILFFTFRFQKNLQNELLQKQREIQATLEFELNGLDDQEKWKNQNFMDQMIGNISEIHSMSVNLFDLEGVLLGSSLPVVFESGITSSRMNSTAYHKFTKNYERWFIQNESIGELSFLSSYVLLNDLKGEPIAYLNLPYYTRDKNLRNEISNFLVALVNVYVLILLLASLLAFLLSNSVTKSLQKIGDKLKELRLGKRNEKLEWPDDDEIGELIKQYNRTIEELDQSAQMLAKSERQFAWQQMAKQIAHEIKNPLTPMKLSIQHLQRAQSENHPEVKELTKRVTKTLIEQIDHLAHIATEFSTFAKVPKASTEVVDLKEALTGIINLYAESSKIRIIKVFPEDDCTVVGDKIQLNRVFHNLVKNAVQATEEKEQPVLIVSIKRNNGRVLLSFADNGKGIAPKDQEMVFAPNFTTKNSGMGLGLAISQNIIENLGGNIWFESVLGEGTTFFIELMKRR